jgi:hypothetical protein
MAPAQNMEMKMKYGLASMDTGVDNEAIPGSGYPLLFGNRITGQHQTPEQPDVRILKLGNRRDMFSRHDERMRRCLRIDIVECNYQIIFVDERRRNGPCHNFAKEALTHEVVPFLSPDFPNRVANS